LNYYFLTHKSYISRPDPVFPLSRLGAFCVFITILAAIIAAYIGALLHNFVKSIVAFNMVSGSFRISKGAVLRFGTATGTIDGMLIEMDRKRVEIEFDDSIKSIPTPKFAEMDWDVVKPGKDTMKTMPNVGDLEVIESPS